MKEKNAVSKSKKKQPTASDVPVWRFRLQYYRPDAELPANVGPVVIRDYSAWLEIRRLLADRRSVNSASDYDCCFIELPENSSALQGILAVLQTAGWTPHFGTVVPPAELGRKFPLQRFRTPAPVPGPDEYAVLHLVGSPTAAVRGVFYRWEEDTLAAICHRPDKAAAMLMGMTSACFEYTVNSRMRDAMLEEGLTGLRLDPVKFFRAHHSHPTELADPYWRICSDITLPWSLNPRVCVSPSLPDGLLYPGDPLPEDCGDHLGFDDKGWFPSTLRYSRREFESAGHFDIARTHEKCGRDKKWPDKWYHPLILSPRFRRFLTSMKVHCTYGPVALVD